MSLTLARYRELRATGMSPQFIARHGRTAPTAPEYPLDWRDHGKDYASATFDTPEGFTVTVSAEYDNEPPDDDYTGRFCSERTPGAIARRSFGDRPGRGEYTHWLPPESEASYRAYFRSSGYGKHAADCAARAMIRSIYKEATSDDPVLCLKVVVEYDGCDLETEYLGLGKVSGRWSEVLAYLTDSAQDTIRDAIRGAQDRAGQLAASFASFLPAPV